MVDGKTDDYYIEIIDEMINSLIEVKSLVKMKKFYKDDLSAKSLIRIDSALKVFTTNINGWGKILKDYESTENK